MTPLVLLHGFTGSAASWDDVLAALPGVHAVRPTLLGHAPESDATRAVHTWSDEIARLAALLPPEPVHLVGYSLGARLALALALTLRSPGRLSHLTLISGQPGLASDTERQARRRSDASWCDLLETQGLEPFTNAWETQPLFATQAQLPAALRARRRAERLAHDPAGLARSLHLTGLAEMPNLLPALPTLTLPVTLITGALDPKFTTLAQSMASALPISRLVTIPNAGHDVLLEAPGDVAAALGTAP